MISELYTTGAGTRMRGSYGNIHNYHNNRSNFGANRAVSLDQYSANNRRSSDGLQQVTSDNNVYYNQHQHRSLDNDVPATITENVRLTTTGDESSSCGDVRSDGDTLNRNIPIDDKFKAQQQQFYQFQQQQQQHNKYTSNKILSSASSAANNGTKSFMSRLRQLTGRLNFSFDRDPKRNNTITASPPNANVARNNNSHETTPITKSSFCCSNRNPSSPSHNRKNELIVIGGGSATAATASNTNSNILSAAAATVAASDPSSNTRNRAYSLDVPVRTRYSSSNSGGGDSRKSSRNDDNNQLMMEDNNSNRTTIGDNRSVSDGIESGNGGSFGGGTGNSI